ncbi:MAG: rhodanese-like domain-containing protein [Microbacteriaceae bacterium]|nr:rhodanese-like domain-containing protein [Microbacteriaceae bacterium]
MKALRIAFLAAIAALLVSSLAACSPGKLDVSNATAIIDTRPSAEFAKSHIVGAINIDYSAGDFSAKATSLLRNGVYFVYGSNEEEVVKAIEDMRLLGFLTVTNVGSFEDAQRLLPLGVTS